LERKNKRYLKMREKGGVFLYALDACFYLFLSILEMFVVFFSIV